MQRKIKNDSNGEMYYFLQFVINKDDAIICIVEDEDGYIFNFGYDSMQFVKEDINLFNIDSNGFTLSPTKKTIKQSKEYQEYQEYLEFKKLRDENMFKVQPSPFFDKNKVTCMCGIDVFKSETIGTHQMKNKSESMPNLQNTVEVWACIDEDGNINISEENKFRKDSFSWFSISDYISTYREDFKQAFQGISWEDKEPKRFRIIVQNI